MSTVTIDDAITPYLSKMLMLSRGFVNQALSKIGSDAQKAMKRRAKNAGTHSWSQKFDLNARRKITFGEEEKDAYSRYSRKSGSKLNGMEDFIKFKLYPETSKLIVGFIDTKRYDAYSFNGGVQKKFGSVKGQKPNKIAEKLENGGRENLTEKQKLFFKASGMNAIAKRGYITRKARPIAHPVFSSIQSSIKKRFQDAYAEAYDSAKIDIKPIRRAI